MKIISLQKNLKNALYNTSHVAQKNTTLPILNNILLSANDGVIKIISTNLEIGITSVIRGKIEAEGSFTVDARIFSEYINLLPNEKVEIKLDKNELTIHCGDNKTKIKGLSAEEFPFIPDIKNIEPYHIPVLEFKEAVGQVIFSAALDENRAELSGILCSLSNMSITLVGTDSYRLAEKTITQKNKVNEEKNCIIPVRTLQEVLRIINTEISENSELTEILLYISENQCSFTIGNTEIVSRLINGRYPDYKQIIPTRHNTLIIVNKDELNRAVKAATLFSKSGVNDIIFQTDIHKKTLLISASSSQTGEHTSVISTNITGEDTTITLNSRYILDVLNIINKENAVIELVDQNTPCIIKNGEEKDYIYIIMPIRN